MFNISFKRYGRIVMATVEAAQVIDSATLQDFGDEIIGFLEDHRDTHILLNFTKVDYMSSATLTELLRVNEVVRRSRGSMRICGLRKEMREVFEITRLDGMFHIEDDCKPCLKKYHKDVSAGLKPG